MSAELRGSPAREETGDAAAAAPPAKAVALSSVTPSNSVTSTLATDRASAATRSGGDIIEASSATKRRKCFRDAFITVGFVLFLVILFLCMFAPRTYPIPNVPPLANGSLRVMSWNVRYGFSDEDLFYGGRDQEVFRLIQTYRPSTIGVQEADWLWMQFLPRAMLEVNYSFVGEGRDGYGSGEFVPLFYDNQRFTLLDAGTFWLSETPDEVSYGWDADSRRVCSWAALLDNSTQQAFVHLNTHLDHKGSEARQKGAEVLLSRMAELPYPAVVTGDMNVMEGGSVYYTFVADETGLGDAKYLAEDTMAWGTINWFTNLHWRFFLPIDFIFVDEIAFHAQTYEVLYQHRYEGQPVSDHFPLFADLTFN